MQVLPLNHEIGKKSPLLFHGYSYGLLGSWMILEQYNLMIDCGDGAATRAASSLGKIKDLIITHPHLDHVGGLTAALNLRHRLNPEQKTTLHFPKECSSRVEHCLAMLGKHTKASIEIKPFTQPNLNDIGSIGELPKIEASNLPTNKEIKIFPTRHCPGSVGYLIIEKRRRLKKNLSGAFVGEMLREISKKSREEALTIKRELEEEYLVTTLAHLGDSPKLNKKELEILSTSTIQTLICEATMLSKEDFDKESQNAHSSLEESLEGACKLQPEETILLHFSPRYSEKEILRKYSENKKRYPLKSVHLLIGEKLIKPL